ncbi:MAG: hypothetical protein JSU68_01090 [Phycisphaerales bacterium]|nr:MAG: hypothetical protein JSU68_01090 [Phycisphaerales bacterium]
MAQTRMNRIRNGNFAAGRKTPTSWQWEVLAGSPIWRLASESSNGDGRRLVVETASEEEAGQWSQSFRCRSKHDYRIEIRGACRAKGGADDGGLSVLIRCTGRDGKPVGPLRCYGPWRSSKLTWWRVHLRTPVGSTRLEMSIRVRRVQGTAELEQVRAIPMDYVCLEPHPISVPPWPFRYARPRAAGSVFVVDESERAERLTAILRARFGRGKVQAVPPGKLERGGGTADAIVVSNVGVLPKSWTWRMVRRWAERRVVVLSLPAFAQLVNRKLPDCVRVRRHEQEDDTLGAQVRYANFITNGFSLLDIFEFAEFDESDGVFRQRQLVRTSPLRQFMRAQGIETILIADTNMEHSSGRPICLYKETPGGALVVMDVDPLLSAAACDNQPNTAAQLLMNVLCAATVSVGQLADPGLRETALIEQIRSMARQIPDVCLSWTGLEKRGGEAGDAQPVLTVGHGHAAVPEFQMPAVLVRTGLDASGRFGVEGANVWLKTLVRPEPCKAWYAPALLRRRQFVWLPFGRAVSREGLASVLNPKLVRLVVDVRPAEWNELRVIVPQRNDAYARYFEVLPVLDKQLRLGRMFGRLPAAGQAMGDADHYAWRSDEAPLVVRADAEAFEDETLALREGTRRVRVEVPATSPPSAANSIVETDRLALLLEWIAGSEIGAVAVNRDPEPKDIAVPVPGGACEATIIEADGEARALDAEEVSRLASDGMGLAPGATLVVERDSSE